MLPPGEGAVKGAVQEVHGLEDLVAVPLAVADQKASRPVRGTGLKDAALRFEDRRNGVGLGL